MGENEQETVERDFVSTWHWIERYYAIIGGRCPELKHLDAMPSLIVALRERGYDQQLRAGQYLTTLILSRSEKRDVRNDQPYMDIILDDSGAMTVTYHESQKEKAEITLERVELTPEVEGLLQRLLAQPID